MERSIDITLYGRPECRLCDEAKATLGRVAPAYAAAVREVNIASDPELLARFGEEIPVVFVDGRKAFKFRVPERELRRRLDRALAERRGGPQEAAR
ncbi:MAG TPA: glutaredoxin family protein [Candidatus Sulfotelmatobacter sp.]|nr:glutaredoxin family protein [Candidatus Sulfotelmatobacter sp.]